MNAAFFPCGTMQASIRNNDLLRAAGEAMGLDATVVSGLRNNPGNDQFTRKTIMKKPMITAVSSVMITPYLAMSLGVNALEA